jgi:hypothetical protein
MFIVNGHTIAAIAESVPGYIITTRESVEMYNIAFMIVITPSSIAEKSDELASPAHKVEISNKTSRPSSFLTEVL